MSLHQNVDGDVVIEVPLDQGDGELVLLPRLWDFDLREVVPGGALLVSRLGVDALVSLCDGGARVDDVVPDGPFVHAPSGWSEQGWSGQGWSEMGWTA